VPLSREADVRDWCTASGWWYTFWERDAESSRLLLPKDYDRVLLRAWSAITQGRHVSSVGRNSVHYDPISYPLPEQAEIPPVPSPVQGDEWSRKAIWVTTGLSRLEPPWATIGLSREGIWARLVRRYLGTQCDVVLPHPATTTQLGAAPSAGTPNKGLYQIHDVPWRERTWTLLTWPANSTSGSAASPSVVPADAALSSPPSDDVQYVYWSSSGHVSVPSPSASLQDFLAEPDLLHQAVWIDTRRYIWGEPSAVGASRLVLQGYLLDMDSTSQELRRLVAGLNRQGRY
jgi:hypothetical protein